MENTETRALVEGVLRRIERSPALLPHREDILAAGSAAMLRASWLLTAREEDVVAWTETLRQAKHGDGAVTEQEMTYDTRLRAQPV